MFRTILSFLLFSAIASNVAFVPAGCLSVNQATDACLMCDIAKKYYLVNGYCNMNFDVNCIAINAVGACITCAPGFSLSFLQICVTFQPSTNCQVYNLTDIKLCTVCMPGFDLHLGQCVPSIAGCIIFDPATLDCVLCNPLMQLIDRRCISVIQNCVVYDLGGHCEQCALGYGLSSVDGSCVMTIPNCLVYASEDTLCLQCNQHSTLLDDGSMCASLIPDCMEYQVNALLPSGYHCTRCKPSFHLALNDTTCKPYNDRFCRSWDAEYTTCLHCDNGSTWSSDFEQCLLVPTDCSRYVPKPGDEGETFCFECKRGFYIDPNTSQCVDNPICGQGFVFCESSFECIAIPYCCATWDDCGTCLTFLPNTGWCKATNACYRVKYLCPGLYDCATETCVCPPGQTWCVASSSCKTVPSCCATHDNCGNCFRLRSGWGFCGATNRCYQLSTECPNNYDCITDSCVCNVGYYWDIAKSSCEEAPFCCATTDSNGFCSTFKPFTGYCAATQSCFSYPQGCTGEWNCFQNECNCPDGSTWCASQKICAVAPLCCINADACGNCIDFLPGQGYCASSKECYELPSDCTHYDCAKGTCYDTPHNCTDGLTYCHVLQSCVAIPSCCVTYDDCGNCLTTKPDWHFCLTTQTCYRVPANCTGSYNCVTQTCQNNNCNWGQVFCVASQKCEDIPDCCLTWNNCGKCISTLPFTGICPQTDKCYFNVGCYNYDCVRNICLDVVTMCSPGQTYCPATQACVAILPCCTQWDQCGNCLAFLPNAGYCRASQQCYVVPVECPFENWDCVANTCNCGQAMTWCFSLQKCMKAPACCATSDNCGNCLTLLPNQFFCPSASTCVTISAVTTCAGYNCGSNACISGLSSCPQSSVLCPLTNTCTPILPCCVRYDECGSCLTTIPGWMFCPFTNQCTAVPQGCQNFDCLNNVCLDSLLCPTGHIYCQTNNQCNIIPACCLAFDHCGNCLTFMPNTHWCSETNSCYFLFDTCQNYDCVNRVCLDLNCPPTSVFCLETKECIPIPTCCATYDNCGHCLSLQPGFGYCEATEECFQVPLGCLTYDCLAGLCSEWMTCPPGQTYCPSLGRCVGIPACCLAFDQCGSCTLTFPNSGFCQKTQTCYYLPSGCHHYDCTTNTCIQTPTCRPNQELCATNNTCINVLPCCALTNGCGECITYLPNQGFCSATNQCFTKPADCVTWDCVLNVCLDQPVCDPDQSFCAPQNACVAIQSCCEEHDECGNCLTFKPNQGWCSALKQCYTKPANCTIWDCVDNICLDRPSCKATQVYCPATQTCNNILPCCDLWDSCGLCLTFKPNTGLCSANGLCYTKPVGCIQYDCLTQVCLDAPTCNSTQSFCKETGLCVNVPSCCLSHNNCGTCLTFKPNTFWCSATDACTAFPSTCTQARWDCLSETCLPPQCAPNQVFCAASNTCNNILSCCVQWDNCGVCQVYRNNTGLCSATGRCFVMPPSCAVYDCVNNVCTQPLCAANQVYCAATNTCNNPISCCQNQDSCGNCLALQPGFSYCTQTSQCYVKPANCAVYDCVTGRCITPLCNSGQTFCPANNTCVNVPNWPCCAAFTPCGQCTQMAPDSIICPATNQCANVNRRCPDTFDCVTGLCPSEECPKGSKFCKEAKECVPVPSCCLTDDTCGKCLTLKPGFSLCSRTGQCFATPNCGNGTHDGCGECLCPPGFNFCILNNRCIPAPPECVFYDMCGRCYLCQPGYNLVGGKCTNFNPTTNCKTDNNTVCVECNPNYFLFNGGCYSIIPNCNTQQANNCVDCFSGFVLVNGRCGPEISNCATYLSLSACDTCRTNFVLHNNACFAVIPNCLSQNGNNCLVCIQGYTLENNRCRPNNNIPDCANFSSPNVCGGCRGGFVLFQNACFIAIPNCASQSGPTCFQCSPNFVLNSANNFCSPRFANCVIQVGSTCNQCANGFILSNNACFATINGCGNQVGSTCHQCLTMYILHGNQCYNSIPNCAFQLGSQCSSCKVGFFLDNNVCTPNFVPANCLFVVNSVCGICNPGFVVNSGTCWPQFCGVYNAISDQCTACVPGATLFNNRCIFIEGCNSINFNTSPPSCNSCRSGTVFRPGSGCLGVRHFIMAPNSTVASNPPYGYSANQVNNDWTLNWGPMVLGSAQTTWYYVLYNNSRYFIKLRLTIGGFTRDYHLATNGNSVFLTTDFNLAFGQMWKLVVHPTTFNLWSIQSSFNDLYLDQSLRLSPSIVYFTIS